MTNGDLGWDAGYVCRQGWTLDWPEDHVHTSSGQIIVPPHHLLILLGLCTWPSALTVFLQGVWVSPDCLISQPACITLVEAILIGGLQLLRGGDDGAVLKASPLGSVKVQCVACGNSSVVEHNACRTHGPEGQQVRCELWLLKPLINGDKNPGDLGPYLVQADIVLVFEFLL